VSGRFTDYDSIADRFERRYELYRYEGIREALRNFLGSGRPRALEVGCGTGHWLLEAGGAAVAIAGVEPSAPMIERARRAAPGAWLVRAVAERLPWRDGTFDRIFCINALHHFADRAAFFAEAYRVLKAGGGLLSIGKDPHAERDSWWVYDYFPETRAVDLERFAPVRALRGELAQAGFAWAQSFEADRIDVLMPAAEALVNGVVDRSFTSQLTMLTDEEFARGAERMRAADRDAGGELQLAADFYLFAVAGWK
jgi:SAM-dependent methyltransferase